MSVRARDAVLWGLALAALSVAPRARAAQIPFGPGDSFAKLEAAAPGDEVRVAPGTYAFRVHLTQKGSAAKPIVIRAADPGSRPVWDLSATLVENAPGSSGAADRGRACWQVDGGTGYLIEGIVITGCHDADKSSAAVRYFNGADVTLRDAYLHGNDNGVTGGTQESAAAIEWSEIAANGDATAVAPTHNLSISGGTFALRYSYVHDSVQAENVHVRAHLGVLESNWFARAKSYEGDLMTSDDAAAGGAFLQTLVVRGNVFVQSPTASNTDHVIAVSNDTAVAGQSFSLRVINNTFVGARKNSAFVHLSNADHTSMQAELTNNILYGTGRATRVEDAAAGVVVGASNWMETGGDAGTLGDTIFGADPGFRKAASRDFTLLPTSSVIGKASTIPSFLPLTEYYKDEITARRYRVRPVVRDLGAFESTSSDPSYGPYDPPPPPPARDGGAPRPDAGGTPIPSPGSSSGGAPGFGADADAGGGSGAAVGSGGASSGCGCRGARGGDGPSGGPGALLVLAVALLRRRDRHVRGASAPDYVLERAPDIIGNSGCR